MATPLEQSLYDPAMMPGGGLSGYRGQDMPPYANLGYTKPQERSNIPGIGNYGLFGAGLLGIHFGGDKKPKTPYYQRLANREWAQGNAALAAQEALYPRSLALAQEQARGYGDLYRAAANESLGFNIRSASTEREADLADYARLAPEYYQAVRGFDPQATGVRDSLYNIIQRDASNIDNPMSSAAAREITQSSYQDSASRGFGPSAQQAALGYISRGLTGDQLSQQHRSQLFQTALQFLGANQQAFGDTFQAITGRPSMPSPQGMNVMAPQTGTGEDDLLSYGINRETAAKNYRAAHAAGNQAMIGEIVGGLLGVAGKGVGALCSVAQEVFGVDNPQWQLFRSWLINVAPVWFLNAYAAGGAEYAERLRERPEEKAAVREWMEERINEWTERN